VVVFWLVDAEFRCLCDAMCDDYVPKVSHLACLRVKWRSSFLACRRQTWRPTNDEGSLHKVCTQPQKLDSILNKECIGSTGSGCGVPAFRSVCGHGSATNDQLSVDEHFALLNALECLAQRVVAPSTVSGKIQSTSGFTLECSPDVEVLSNR
jgi:hypothetical protein